MKLHLPCLLLILVFNTYEGSADLPRPELQFENNIIEDEDTKITCTIRNPTCLEVTLEIKGNVTLTHCEDTPADCFTNEHYTTKICTIEVTKEMDQMEFTCEAHFKTQSRPKKMYLQREPEFTDCPEEQVWKEGEENSFHCIATGYPQPNVTCQKKNQKDATVYRAGERFTTKKSMAGNYTCTAKTFDITSKFVKVSLQYKPAVRNIIVDPLLHNEGDPVTITCEADGEPAPSYIWKTPSSDVQYSPDNKTITIQKMASSHLGKYQCTASNMIGSHSLEQELNLAVRPIISNLKVEPSMELPVGSNVTLTCDAGGTPPPTFSWIHPKVKVQKSEDQRIINIRNITTNHAGNYSCTAQNKHGTTTRTQQVTVSVKPKVLSINVKPSTSVSENDNLTLTCVAQGVPLPSFSWQYPTPNVLLSPDGSTINVYAAQKDHTGDYICTAQNKHGRDTMTKSITVTGKGNGADRLEMTIILILATLISTGLMIL